MPALGETVPCPRCEAAPLGSCVGADRHGRAEAHSQRVHLEAWKTVGCDEPRCEQPPGHLCVAQNGHSRARVHGVRLEAHRTAWEERQRQEPAAPGLPSGLLNTVIHGDALAQMKKLPAGSFNLIITSPPYNRLNSVGHGIHGNSGGWQSNPLVGGYGEHGDDMDVAAYIDWQRQCFWEFCRLLAPDGVIFYNHAPRIQGGQWESHGHVITQDKKLPRDFQRRDVVVWDRRGGVNRNPGYCPKSHEYLFLVARKGEWKERGTMVWPDVWPLGTDSTKRGVPAFPVAIPRRAMQCFENPGVVLDPFMGSGTTGVAAMLEGWQYVGIENDGAMVDSARERIANAETERVDDRPAPADQATIERILAQTEAAYKEVTGKPMDLDVYRAIRAAAYEGVDTVQPEAHEETVQRDVATGDTVQWDKVSATLEAIDKIIYDVVHRRTNGGQLGEVQIDVSDFESATGKKRRTVMYGLGRLSDASLINRRQSRGASYYSISGVIPRWPAKVAGGIGTPSETVQSETVQPDVATSETVQITVQQTVQSPPASRLTSLGSISRLAGETVQSETVQNAEAILDFLVNWQREIRLPWVRISDTAFASELGVDLAMVPPALDFLKAEKLIDAQLGPGGYEYSVRSLYEASSETVQQETVQPDMASDDTVQQTVQPSASDEETVQSGLNLLDKLLPRVHSHLRCSRHLAKLQLSTWPTSARLGGDFWYCPSTIEGRPCSLLYHGAKGILRYPNDPKGHVTPEDLAPLLAEPPPLRLGQGLVHSGERT